MKFNTIEEIKAHEFVGNAMSDADAFVAIDEFAQSAATLEDKAEALRVMGDKGMGLGREEHKSNQQVVDEYFEEVGALNSEDLY